MKHLVISSFYTSVPKIMIICYTAPEIWHKTDAIMFHFGQFFALLQPRKLKISKKKNDWRYHHLTQTVPKIMIIYFIVPEIWHVTDVIVIFHFGLIFALLPPKSLKNKNFKKMKKRPEITSFYTSVPKTMISYYFNFLLSFLLSFLTNIFRHFDSIWSLLTNTHNLGKFEEMINK